MISGTTISTNTEFADNSPPLTEERDSPTVAYYIKACIQGVRRDMLVDTGASVTISHGYFQTIPNVKCKPASISNVEGIVAGSQLELVGEITVPIKIGAFLSEPHKILIVKGMKYFGILGLDYLDRFYVSVDTNYRRLRIEPPGIFPISLAVKTVTAPNVTDYRAFSIDTVCLGPRSVQVIEL